MVAKNFVRVLHACALLLQILDLPLYSCLYQVVQKLLRSDSYYPKGASPSISNRLFAMYHARVDDEDNRGGQAN